MDLTPLHIEALVIRPFQPADQPAARGLVLAGLAEHWGALDPSLNPDLDDIAASFAGGVFLTAWLGAELVGTGGLLPAGPHTAQIVRMSVAAPLRRRGIARRILAALLDAARQAGYRRVILETTETWDEVIQFYLSCGFRITHHQDGDVYFEISLE